MHQYFWHREKSSHEKFLRGLNNLYKHLTPVQLSKIDITMRGDHMNLHVNGNTGTTLVLNKSKPIHTNYALNFYEKILKSIE